MIIGATPMERWPGVRTTRSLCKTDVVVVVEVAQVAASRAEVVVASASYMPAIGACLSTGAGRYTEASSS